MFAFWTIKKLAPHLVWVQDNCIFAGFVVLFPFLSAELEMTWLPDTKEKLTAKRQWKWILFGKISSMKNSTSYRRILAKIGRHNISLSGIHFWALLPLWEVQLNSKHETTLGSLREARGRPWNHQCLSKEKQQCHENNERKELKSWQCFRQPLISTLKDLWFEAGKWGLVCRICPSNFIAIKSIGMTEKIRLFSRGMQLYYV